jgi:hypothetical protein
MLLRLGCILLFLSKIIICNDIADINGNGIEKI